MKTLDQIGEHLRIIRKRRDLSIPDVAHNTKIRPHLISAIENGDTSQFASASYLKSFAKQYGDFLDAELHDFLESIETDFDLQSDDLISRAEQLNPIKTKPRTQNESLKRSHQALALSLQPLVVFGLTAVLVILATFLFQHFNEEFGKATTTQQEKPALPASRSSDEFPTPLAVTD